MVLATAYQMQITSLTLAQRISARRGEPLAPASKKVLVVFGTRPEAVKLAPVVRALAAYDGTIQTVTVTTAQHTDLLYPLLASLDIRLDYDLRVMRHGQSLNRTCARVLAALDSVLAREQPDLVLVQGDTTTALSGALAAFNRGIMVGHVEAGLRSGDLQSPFPEEANRRLISRLATYHFAATNRNREELIREGVDWRSIFVTGNPVVDSLLAAVEEMPTANNVQSLLCQTEGKRRVVLTSHRRENFGRPMLAHFKALRRFVENHDDLALIFPVHPNPAVGQAAREILAGHDRIHLIEPLDYADFIRLLSRAWLIVSDSGGVQEEAPTLGRPLLILRENTERPEVIEAGAARLVGNQPGRLATMLKEAYAAGSWVNTARTIPNPFGRGDAGKQIADTINKQFASTTLSTTLSRRRAS